MVRVFYAGGFTKVPFFVTLVGSVSAVLFTLTLYKSYGVSLVAQSTVEGVMRIGGVPGSEVLTLAFGYSVAIILQTLTLVVMAGYAFGLPARWLPVHMLRSVLAAVVGGFCAYVALNFFIFGINEETFIGIFLQGLMGGIAGIVGIVSTYVITRSPELREIGRSLRARRKKTEVIVPQDELI